jgi:hypothetical protein
MKKKKIQAQPVPVFPPVFQLTRNRGKYILFINPLKRAIFRATKHSVSLQPLNETGYLL